MTDPRVITIARLINLIVYISTIIWLTSIDWQIAAAVFIMIWANNTRQYLATINEH